MDIENNIGEYHGGQSFEQIKSFLNHQVAIYNSLSFIEDDPISVPHRFTKLQDIEIAAFFAAILAWGNRKTILKSAHHLLAYMDNAPYDFVENFQTTDLKPLSSFVHRTFNATDLIYMLYFLRSHYRKYNSLEMAFTQFVRGKSTEIKELLTGFHHYFFHLPDAPQRTRKHIASPEKKSACKRLNMFLRWMVRKDKRGVDFGLWTQIKPAGLICPLDVHSASVARSLGLLKRQQNDWQSAEALTVQLRRMKPEDPAIYDFALFSLGVNNK